MSPKQYHNDMRQKIYTIFRWGFFTLLLLIIYQTIRIGWAGWPVYQDVIALRQQLSDDSPSSQTSQAESQIALLTEHLTEFHNQIQPIAFLLECLEGIPGAASTILPIISSGIQLMPQTTQLIGLEEPQTYLVLLQNNHELRATGGFIASVGEITLTNGKLGDFRFRDSYDIFHFEPPYPPLPMPMQTYMDIETLYLRDANWSPHLPTTARLVRDLYFLHTGVQATGVITVDLHAVTLLVEALQPIYIQGRDEPVTAENVLDVVVSFWNQSPEVTESDEWWVSRKDFIPLFAEGAIAAAKAKGMANIELVQAVQEALNRRFVQAWVDDSHVSVELAKRGWDGALHPSQEADYLALVDSNLGFNKADAVLQRTIEYAVDWPDQGLDPRARATVTVTYDHTLEKSEHECDITPRYGSEGAIYDEMFERCYFGYPRLYAPMGSELIAVHGVEEESAMSQRGELRTQVFSGYFIMEPGQQHQVLFEYWLPSTIVADDYELIIQRQAGIENLPVNLKIQDQEIALDLTEGIVHWDDF